MRRSWDDFGAYAAANITVTQRLLDAVLRRGGSSASSTPRACRCMGTVPGAGAPRAIVLSPSVRTGSPSSRPSTSVVRTPRTSACRLSRCDTSPSTDRASGPTWPSTGSSRRRGMQRRSRSTVTVDKCVTSRMSTTSSPRTWRPSAPIRRRARSSTWPGGVRRRCVRWSSSSESLLVAQSSSTLSRSNPATSAPRGLTRLASQLLGGEPQTDLRTGVNRQVAWPAERAAVAYA